MIEKLIKRGRELKRRWMACRIFEAANGHPEVVIYLSLDGTWHTTLDDTCHFQYREVLIGFLALRKRYEEVAKRLRDLDGTAPVALESPR